ncbi:hypothetical protein ACRAKI_14255 [Saccharothrix isguenensis]
MNPGPVIDQDPGEQEWAGLTRSARKRELFTEDLYFREAWADALSVFGDRTTAVMGELALLNFKCDGLIGRRIGPTLSYLSANGFQVVGVSPMRHNRHSMRELWRYNWHVYTIDRLALTTVMHDATDTMLLILRDTRYDGVVPGSVRLADMKGSANPAGRDPNSLRSVLQPPNRVINFVHVADEPADIVREVGIFLDRAERRELFAQVRDRFTTGADDEAAALRAKLEAEYAENDFDIGKALLRVEQTESVSAEDMAELRTAVDSGESLSWDRLRAIFPPDSPVDRWDFVMIATETMVPERTGVVDLLPASSRAEWAGPA